MVHETYNNNLIIENTSDGYIENIKLDGKTLVNLWGNKASDFLLSGQATFNEETGYIELTSISHRYSNVFTKYPGNLKPSTLYTIIVDIVENTFSDVPILRVSSADSVAEGNDTYACFTDTKVINGGKTGRFIFKITTIDNIRECNIGLRTFIGNDNLEVGCKLKFRITILEGDNEQIPQKYFKGLKSVGDGTDKVIISSNKGSGNLLHCEDFSISRNGVTFTYDSVNQEFTLNGTCTADNTSLFPHYMATIYNCPLQGAYSGRLILSNPNMANFNVRFYEKTFTRGVILNNKRLTHGSVYKDGDIVSFSIRIESGQTFNNDKFKVCFNKGDTPIPYEPYKEHKKELLYKDTDGVWKKPILRRWDTLERHSDGKYYYHKRSGETLLNGSEMRWKIAKFALSGNTICFQNILEGSAFGTVGDMDKISDKFPSIIHSSSNFSLDYEFISGLSSTSASIGIRIHKDRLATIDVASFKKWLKANPVTVVYKLMEEEVYECLPISVASYDNETIYKIESGDVSPVSSFELDYTLSNTVNRVLDVKTFSNAMIDNIKANLTKIKEVL